MEGKYDKSVLLLGGARSGKSCRAQEMVLESGLFPLYCATGVPVDEEMAQRIERHKKERGRCWRTIEAPFGFTELLRKDLREFGVVVDCVTFLLNNLLFREKDPKQAFNLLCAEFEALFGKRKKEHFFLLLVSNEVGMGIVPEYPEGRVFRDLQGRVNQWLASQVEEVYFLLAGIPWQIK